MFPEGFQMTKTNLRKAKRHFLFCLPIYKIVCGENQLCSFSFWDSKYNGNTANHFRVVLKITETTNVKCLTQRWAQLAPSPLFILFLFQFKYMHAHICAMSFPSSAFTHYFYLYLVVGFFSFLLFLMRWQWYLSKHLNPFISGDQRVHGEDAGKRMFFWAWQTSFSPLFYHVSSDWLHLGREMREFLSA